MGYGVGGSGAGYISDRIPLAFGVSLGYLTYGSESREEPFSSTIPDVVVDVTTTNSILLGHLLVRLQGRQGMLRPYFEGMAGFSYLFTKTKITDVDNEDEDIASSTNLDDFVFSYGASAGVMVVLYEGVADVDGEGTDKGGTTEPFALSLDLGISYLLGGEASYLKKGSIHRSGDRVAYDILRSETDLLVAHIGVTLSR
jgi:hypothetical protein